MSSDSNSTKFKDFINTSYININKAIKFLSTIFIRILDKLVNGFTIKKTNTTQHKYYRFFIGILLIVILGLFYYLNEKQNLFAIKNTKYEILFILLLILFSIYSFLFFVYRNHTEWTSPDTASEAAKAAKAGEAGETAKAGEAGETTSKAGKESETTKDGKDVKESEAAKDGEATSKAAKESEDREAIKAAEDYDTNKEYAEIYNSEKRKIIDLSDIKPTIDTKGPSDDAKASSNDIKSATLNKENLKKTLTIPLFNIMKYLFYLLLIISIPLFIISNILYLHNNNDKFFNITKNILIVLVVLTALAIIAAIFSIKAPTTSSGSIYCEMPPKKKDGKDHTFTELLKNYAYYFLCIFKNFIFFIPCLIVILVDELNKDIRLTPGPVYILFFILILLVILLFLLPVIFKFIKTSNKSDVLQGSGPFYLNQERTLGKYQNLNTNLSKNITLPNVIVEQQTTTRPNEEKLDKIMSAFNINKDQYKDQQNLLNNSLTTTTTKDTSNNGPDIKSYSFTLFNDINSAFNIKGEYNNSVISKEKFPYNYTYSISFYIYLNPQPENTSLAYTKDTVLFNYAFKPVILYNGKSQKIIVKSRTISNRGDQLDTIYELENPKFQKWLFFVINYDNNIIDVFIDGKLVGSKENVSPYFKGDSITIGEKDGIHGSIKEIYYYDKITSVSTIELLYNLSKNSA